MASVSLRKLTKVFRPPVRVLDDINLEVTAGEFVAILGPSGCGKSTILRCLAGLEPPTSGELLIEDRVVNDLAPAERDVAMVFQNYALYPHLTVLQNLEFPLQMRKVPRDRQRTLLDDAARRLELETLLDRMPGELSGGQRQRVALGRALVRQPKVFLFDEPLSNLDASLRVQLRAELMGLHQSLGTTMLYVTHDQVEALTMGQRVVVMNNGRVQQVGTPAEVYNQPVNVFVARFVGSPGMNLLPGNMAESDTGPTFVAQGMAFPYRKAEVPAAQVGVRPEYLRLTPPGGGLGNGEVHAVERLGSETLVHVKLSSTTMLVARLPGLVAVDRGNRVGVQVEYEHLHWFDGEGRRL
ncbi:MAG: sn-glycerol-3-phosphate ABC transporter ATP-binding protein UgpC [Gemmatimonadota bacterium]